MFSTTVLTVAMAVAMEVRQLSALVVAVAAAAEVLQVSAGVVALVSMHRLNTALTHAARTDELTGLANRRGLAVAIAGYVRRQSAPAVLLLDLRRFKTVNDRYGYHSARARFSVGGSWTRLSLSSGSSPRCGPVSGAATYCATSRRTTGSAPS